LLLVDAGQPLVSLGDAVAEHGVELDPAAWEFEAFTELYGRLRRVCHARSSDRRLESEQQLGVSRLMIYRYIECGDLSAVRVGTQWRMRAGDVVALARHRAEQAEAIDMAIAAALEAGDQAGRHVDAKHA
jgi:excisionase family DNA binding protein